MNWKEVVAKKVVPFVLVIGGLSLISVGLWQFDPRYGLISIGFGLILLGIGVI